MPASAEAAIPDQDPGIAKVANLPSIARSYWLYTNDPYDNRKRQEAFDAYGFEKGLEVFLAGSERDPVPLASLAQKCGLTSPCQTVLVLRRRLFRGLILAIDCSLVRIDRNPASPLQKENYHVRLVPWNAFCSPL